MRTVIGRFFNRIRNRIRFSRRKKFSQNSLNIYKTFIATLNHPDMDILCDPLTNDILISLEPLGYDIVITPNEIIITNHEFPTLGPVEGFVLEKITIKAKRRISKMRQAKKESILNNNENLSAKVAQKVIDSGIEARRRVNAQKKLVDDAKTIIHQPANIV